MLHIQVHVRLRSEKGTYFYAEKELIVTLGFLALIQNIKCPDPEEYFTQYVYLLQTSILDAAKCYTQWIKVEKLVWNNLITYPFTLIFNI